ncbi:uncharacterized protein EV422DRAFT_370051 [Fimicolochytrium jonesii]|uniref:uncharacterized protein n=1 Tax=Fimicolochytrium jonesii TaxID=1396493 RepID=UPI0022FEAD55|nr:uncharacterized protein EV422DRAFT_370051 [Fimicolochytrium jonesii]KAI8823784.1 hypothetical protein EV422DRAFT_370051 [Fimicolochytrium jonesii]
MPNHKAVWRAVREALQPREMDISADTSPFSSYMKEMRDSKYRNEIWFPAAPTDVNEIKRVKILSNISNMLDVEEKAPMTEATWIAYHIWPLFGVSFDSEITVTLDHCSSGRTRKRPDLVYSFQDRGQTRVLLIAEIKTPYAAPSQRNKELARLVRRGLESLKQDTISFDHGGHLPNGVLGTL